PQPHPQPGLPPQPGPPPPLGPTPPTPVTGETIELNNVSFEQLRGHGLSVTQATRLLAHRERVGRFQSIDELDEIPGLPREFAEDLKRRSEV
ncbi:MAG TPA: helix-hairpin-helix domain-containing protein, partial [Solirubrobacterales bacterium]